MYRVIEAGLDRIIDRAVERDGRPGYVVLYRVGRDTPVEVEVKRYMLGLPKGTVASERELNDYAGIMRPDERGRTPRVWILPAEDNEWRRSFRKIREVEPLYDNAKEELFVLRMVLESGLPIVAIIAGWEKRGALFGDLKLIFGLRARGVLGVK